MRDTTRYWVILPRWVAYFVTGLLFLVRRRWWVAFAILLLALIGTVPVFGSMTSLPPDSREASLCFMLGTEAPCAYHEIGRLKGTVTFAVADHPTELPTLLTLFTAKRQSHARLELHASVSETDLLDRVRNPATNWDKLIPPSETWPTLRTLARVTDGVPVIVAAVPVKGDADHAGDALASVASLRVRLAFLVLD